MQNSFDGSWSYEHSKTKFPFLKKLAPNKFIPYQCATDGLTASFVPQIFTFVDSIRAKSSTLNKAFKAASAKYVVGAPVSTKKWTDSGSPFFPSGSTGKQIIGRAWGPKRIPFAMSVLFWYGIRYFCFNEPEISFNKWVWVISSSKMLLKSAAYGLSKGKTDCWWEDFMAVDEIILCSIK